MLFCKMFVYLHWGRMNSIGKHPNESHFSRFMYTSLKYLGYLSIFIFIMYQVLWWIKMFVTYVLSQALYTCRIRKLKLRRRVNCPKLNGLRLVGPGFEPGHVASIAHTFSTVLNISLPAGKGPQGWIADVANWFLGSEEWEIPMREIGTDWDERERAGQVHAVTLSPIWTGVCPGLAILQ